MQPTAPSAAEGSERSAKELAVEHGIQFIERVNFSAGIQRKLEL